MSKKGKKSHGARMKEDYEYRQTFFLTRKIPVLMRLDGKAFHTFTKGCEKPFDQQIIGTMQSVTKFLLESIQGAKVAYVQSDEISLLLTDYERTETEAWFDYNQSKMESISAAMASVRFTMNYPFGGEEGEHSFDELIYREAHFDSRARNYPKEEIINYFRWRYQDWSRNSIQMLAQSLYSQKELHGQKTPALHELCFQKGKNWNDLPGECKNGTLYVRDPLGTLKYTEFNLMNDEFCQTIFGQYI